MRIIGTRISISHGSAVRFALPGQEFRLWTDFGTALIQKAEFHVPNLMHKLLNRILYTVVLPFAELPSSAVIKIGA